MGSKKDSIGNRRDCDWDEERERYACHIADEDDKEGVNREAKVAAEAKSNGTIEIDQESFKGDYSKEEREQIKEEIRNEAETKVRRNRGGKAFTANG